MMYGSLKGSMTNILYMKLFICFLLFIFSTNLKSQKGEACDQMVYIAYQMYKQKDIDNMYYNWKRAFVDCPGHDKKIYIVGAKIFQNKIKEAQSEHLKNKYIDSLMLMYDQRIKYFQSDENYVFGRKGVDLLKYGDLNEAFELLEKSVLSQVNKSEPHVLLAYFESVVLLYSKKSKKINDILEAYNKVVEIFEYNLDGKKASTYQKYYNKVESKFAPFATCETLVDMYSEKIDSYLNDTLWLTRAENILRKKNCDNTNIYFKISEKLYELNPSERSANAMANMLAKKKKYSKAVKFYLEAIKMNSSSNSIHEYYYGVSLCYYSMKDFRSAIKYANYAINKKPNWGIPYILLGDVFIESVDDCAKNSFEVSLMYCGAVQYYLKSKEKDGSSSNRKIADRKIKSYESYFPSSDKITKEGYSVGDKYSLGCFLSDKIVIANNVSALQRFR